MHPVNGTGNSPSPGRPTLGVVKQAKSSGGSVDTTKTRLGPQRVRMSSGKGPIGAAKGKQPDTEALCQPPPPPRNARPASHTLVSLHPWPCVTFTLLVVVSTSQPGVFVMTAYRALMRPSGEDAMGRSCILDSPPPQAVQMLATVWMPAAVQMPACHARRFKGERPVGAATG